MKIGGIIAEYNPFHNGHKYQIDEYKRLHNISHLVVAMSGNFIQRGGPSIVDKFSRAEIALKNGADLVLEIPSMMSTQTAEIYAKGGILTLESLGCVDSICFGSELGDIQLLKKSAEVILGKHGNYEESVRSFLNSGDSFPIAREKAIIENLSNMDDTIDKNFLKKSNNILGIEYLKVILSLKSNIVPETIKRYISSHNSLEIEGKISSATSIRNLIFNNEKYINYVPEETSKIIYDEIMKNARLLNDESFFIDVINVIIRDEDINRYFDINEGIKNLILNNIFSSKSMDEFLNKVSNKTYTKSRIRRGLFNILLNIKKTDIVFLRNIDSLPYVRVLGFNEKGTEILKIIKMKNSKKIGDNEFDIILSPSKTKRKSVYKENDYFKNLLDFDLSASNMYYQKYFSNNRKLLSKGEIDYITLKKIL